MTVTSDSLIALLDRLGDAHEAYATSVGLKEAQLMEDRCNDLRKQILDVFAALERLNERKNGAAQ